MPDEVIVTAWRQICAIAPACSEESEAFNDEDPHDRVCPWRDKLRDAQRIARVCLKELGESEIND